MKLILSGIGVLLILSTPVYAPAQRVPIIDVTKGFIEAIPLAIVPFALEGGAEPQLQDQLHEVLRNDLEFSNYFYLMPNRGQIEEIHQLDEKTGKVNHAAWRGIGADAVVKGKISREAADKVSVEMSLHYCKGGYQVFGRSFTSERKNFRQLVHRLSDRIVFHLTGNPGLAQTRIAFIYETLGKGGSVRDLHLIDYDGYPESLTRITNDRSMVIMPAWSPDGQQIAFTSYLNKNPDLFSINLKTGLRRQLSAFPGLNNSPAWNPNGQDLVLVLSKDGNSELYRLDLRKGQFTRLTNDPWINAAPCYSPDGKRLVCTSDSGRVVKLIVMDADGRNPKRISPPDGWYDSGAWAPWGDLIAFVGTRDSSRRFNIYTARSDGTGLRQLTHGQGSNESPCWSPDGRLILFTSNRDGNWNLYTMDRNGENVRRITFLPGNCYSPRWSPVPEQD